MKLVVWEKRLQKYLQIRQFLTWPSPLCFSFLPPTRLRSRQHPRTPSRRRRWATGRWTRARGDSSGTPTTWSRRPFNRKAETPTCMILRATRPLCPTLYRYGAKKVPHYRIWEFCYVLDPPTLISWYVISRLKISDSKVAVWLHHFMILVLVDKIILKISSKYQYFDTHYFLQIYYWMFPVV